jgi:hypothetical protein
MSASDDGQTHPALARAGWRKSYWRHLDRRFGEMGDFLPKRCDRAPGELYKRRLYRVAVEAIDPNRQWSGSCRSEPPRPVTPVANRDEASAPRLQLPNCFPTYNWSHGPTLQFPSLKGRVARSRLEFAGADRPLPLRIDHRDIGFCLNRQRARINP